jgi:hypothetical protein
LGVHHALAGPRRIAGAGTSARNATHPTAQTGGLGRCNGNLTPDAVVSGGSLALDRCNAVGAGPRRKISEGHSRNLNESTINFRASEGTRGATPQSSSTGRGRATPVSSTPVLSALGLPQLPLVSVLKVSTESCWTQKAPAWSLVSPETARPPASYHTAQCERRSLAQCASSKAQLQLEAPGSEVHWATGGPTGSTFDYETLMQRGCVLTSF